jgi:hypothetical protein
MASDRVYADKDAKGDKSAARFEGQLHGIAIASEASLASPAFDAAKTFENNPPFHGRLGGRSMVGQLALDQ